MTQDNKIFDEYEVDCNECESYWDNSCDGVKVNDKRSCTAFKAVRKSDIPKRVDKLENTIKRMDTSLLLLYVALLLHLVSHFGG